MVFNIGHPTFVVLVDADHQSEDKKIELVMIFPSAASVDPAQRGPGGEDCVECARGAHGPQGQDGSQPGAGGLSWRSR